MVGAYTKKRKNNGGERNVLRGVLGEVGVRRKVARGGRQQGSRSDCRCLREKKELKQGLILVQKQQPGCGALP